MAANEYEGEELDGGPPPPPTILGGEDAPMTYEPDYPQYISLFDIPVQERILTFDEASKCLNKLGLDESGSRYAYLMITAIDKELTNVSVILNFKHVMFLDLSGNFLNLDALQVLSKMPFLIYLKADRNRLESAAIKSMPFLQILSMNANRIEETGDIEQPILETLNLEYNQIFTAHFASDKLSNLKELDLKGNNLMDLTGTYPENLDRLFIAENKIRKLDQLATSKLNNLTALHLRDNKIRKLNGFTNRFSKLKYLNIRNNKITKLRQFRKLRCLPNLKTLICLDNPVMGKKATDIQVPGEDQTINEKADDEVLGEDEPAPGATSFDPIRIGILVLLPNLIRINKEKVTLVEREEAKLIKDIKLAQIMDEESSEDETDLATTTYTASDYDDDIASENETMKAGGFDATNNSMVDDEDVADDDDNEEEEEDD